MVHRHYHGVEQSLCGGVHDQLVQDNLEHLRIIGHLVHSMSGRHGEMRVSVGSAARDKVLYDLFCDSTDDAAAGFGFPAHELSHGCPRGGAAEKSPALDEQCHASGSSCGDVGVRAP